MDAALAPDGGCPPSTAAKLRGKAQWALCLGRVGRAALQPLTRRQYATAPDDGDAAALESWPLCPDLRSSLLCIRALMAGALPDVEIRLGVDDHPPVVVMSDAMWRPSRDEPLIGFGRVAYLVWVPLLTGGGKLAYAEADAPREMLMAFAALRAKSQYICDLEEVALAAPYFSEALADSLRGQQVIHFADNVAANCGAIGGGSSSPTMGRIIHALHMRWAFERVNPWIEFVKSEANLADDPSRGDMTWAEGLGAVPIEFVFPPCGGWDDSM